MATTAKAGSRSENCPLLITVRQRRRVLTPRKVFPSLEHGMDAFVNKAVSINSWASLVPAAAVIPALEAYADFADIETLVVDC